MGEGVPEWERVSQNGTGIDVQRGEFLALWVVMVHLASCHLGSGVFCR
jgi:hypothetical protein